MLTLPAARRCAPQHILLLVAQLMPAGATAAIDSSEGRAVVERYVKVIGGAEAVLNERTTRIKGTVAAFGLSGTFEEWAARPDRSANATTIGPFTLREGYDGAVAWRVDQNGKLARQDGKDLEEAKASAWFLNGMWLRPDPGGGGIQLVGRQTDSTGAYTVLEVRPPVGRARVLWFSDKTGLIEREVTKHDVQTVTSRLSDYRMGAGMLRAHKTVVEIEGMPMNTVTITVDSVWSNPEIAPAVFSPPDAGVADARFLSGRGPVRLPFRYSARHVWFDASVNGAAPERFLLDTGASITAIDSAWAAAHGIKVEGRIQVAGAGASGGAGFARLDSVRVTGPDGDGVALGSQKVAVVSINPYIEPFFWQPVAGILGYDFISRFVMEVDYDHGTLTLHDPKTFTYAGPGQGIPMTMAGNIPVVKAKMDGEYEGEFRLDVGSGSTVDLHSPFVKRHSLRDKVGRSHEVVGGGFGGTFTSTVCRMKKMEIGPFAWSDPVVILSRASVGGLASEDYAGNIGNQVLERFKCTFDYERRVVHLEPGQGYTKRDRFSQAGFQLARFGSEVRAIQVLPDSPAEKAGIHANDQVLAVDGKPIASYTVDDIRRLFEEGTPGSKHAVVIARDGKRKKVKLTLAEML